MKRSICICILLLLVISVWSFGPMTGEANALKIITLTSPVDSTKVSTATPTFQWRVSGPAWEIPTRFHIKLADNLSLTNPIWEDSSIVGTARSVVYPGDPALEEWKTYYWAVRVEVDVNGVVSWQEDFSPTSTFFFTTATLFSIRADGSGDLPTIQEAIVWAAAGDTVWVDKGIYHENLRVYKRSLLITSNYLFDHDTAAINGTVIDGSSLTRGPDYGSVVYFSGAADSSSSLMGFTIRGGAGSKVTVGIETRTSGGGIFCDAGSTPTIAYNVITENQVQHDGGGIFINSGAPNIFHNIITNNRAVEGTGGAVECRFSIEVKAAPGIGQGGSEGETIQKTASESRANMSEEEIKNSLNPRDATEVASTLNNPPVAVCEDDPIYGDTLVGFDDSVFYNLRLDACASYDPDEDDQVNKWVWRPVKQIVPTRDGYDEIPFYVSVKDYYCTQDVHFAFGGLLKFYLKVVDTHGDTSATYDSVFLSVQYPPLGNAGPDQIVRPEETAYLHGTAKEINPDQRELIKYSWRWVAPPPAATPIQPSKNIPDPHITPRSPGVYHLGLTVQDPYTIAEEDDDIIVVANHAPQAHVNNVDHAFEGDTVLLDGSRSYDIDSAIFQHEDSSTAGKLDFTWTVRFKPAAAQMPVIVDAKKRIAKFVPYGAGTYTFRLLVNDTLSVKQAPDSIRAGSDSLANIDFLQVKVDSTYAYPIIQGNLISGNLSGSTGGAVNCNNSSPDIISNVFYRNQSQLSGGAICARNSSTPQILSNVFFGNISKDSTGGAIANLGVQFAPSATRGFRKDLAVKYNDFWENRGGTLYQPSGNISDNIYGFPRLYDPDFGDFRYECGSTVFGAGDPLHPDIGELVFFPECITADRLNMVALSLFQNPVATAATHFVINTDVPLKGYPVAYVSMGDNAPSPVYFAPVASKTYRGSFVFTGSGSAEISIFASSLLERDTVITEDLSVQLIGAGRTGRLASTDGRVGVLFPEGSAKEQMCAVCIPVSKHSRYGFEGDAQMEAFGEPYQLGPSISFDKNPTVSFSLSDFDLGNRDRRFFSVYRYEDGKWNRLESHLDGDRVCAEAKSLGVFRLIYDPNAKPLVNRPETYRLFQNYPNPFNPETQIKYDLPVPGDLTLSVYNVLGQRVRVLVDGFQDAGHRSVIWDGKDDDGRQVASGIYFYKIEAENYQRTKKMVLLK